MKPDFRYSDRVARGPKNLCCVPQSGESWIAKYILGLVVLFCLAQVLASGKPSPSLTRQVMSFLVAGPWADTQLEPSSIANEYIEDEELKSFAL
jgi:hypothetical protein